ncbi:MAG: hypothetical protein Q4G71_15465 [Pseudomonadota bacterium]|nr:hypothetical protein [Pseudomonadota bacterium]
MSTDTGGMSIEGSVPSHGRLGAIVYGESAVNRIRMEGEDSLFAAFRHYSPDWAVVEHNTGELTQASRLGSYGQAYRSLREMANYGARFVSSMAWNGSPGDTQGMAGFLGYTSLRRSPLEEAMQDFMLARADLPRRARLWSFGAGTCADDDGWLVDGRPAVPAGAGQLVLTLGADGFATLLSPGELAWSCDAHPWLVLQLEAAPAASLRLSVQGQTADGQWHELAPEAALPPLAGDLAGARIALTGTAPQPCEHLQLRWRGPPGGRVTLRAITLYPARSTG